MPYHLLFPPLVARQALLVKDHHRRLKESARTFQAHNDHETATQAIDIVAFLIEFVF